MNDLTQNNFAKANNLICAHFGKDWPEVPLRRWEYCAAAAFSGVMAKPGVALDAGCGRSIFPQFLSKIGCEVYAIDPGIHTHRQDGVNYRKASMTEIGAHEEYFDYVFAISSIEHVNAGRFTIKGLPFDTGDAEAMLELCRVLKAGGKLVLTTDYAEDYHKPPGLWPSGSHRIYNESELYRRLLAPAIALYGTAFYEGKDLKIYGDINKLEPLGYDYTALILTLKKASTKEIKNGNKMS